MSNRLIKILIIVSLILLIISAFEILNVESYYEDQEFVNASKHLLVALKQDVVAFEIATGFFTVVLIGLLILKSKKAR